MKSIYKVKPIVRWCRRQLFGMSLVLLALAGCREAARTPPELLGVWVASGNATYEGSSFEITPATITFRRGETYQDRNTIVAISANPANDKMTYDIRYRNFAGGEQTLSLFHFPGATEPLIRFKYQQDVVWRRSPGGNSAGISR